ncbi:FtsW/RodA/SpoVE family cell cycle protein [Vasconcelosia minhoensis]|nr:FtsW/RodA/SpoVE family cell cycle protein [Romeria gracilis]
MNRLNRRFAGAVSFFSIQDWALEARLLRWLTMLWLSVGLVVLFSASYPVANAETGDGARYFKIQLLYILVGLLLSRWVTRHPLRHLIRLSGIALLVSMSMILATHIPGLGVSVNGATRWLPLGPFLLQPSELMKPFLVLHGAQLFGRWHRLSLRRRLSWLGIYATGLALILTQPNLSTTAVCGTTLWLIALAAGLPYSQLLLTAFSGLLAALISVSLKSYQRDRIVSFLNPWADADGNGYQLIQSLLAVGSGGTWGSGYGLSQQKLFFLPIQYTDFIFSVYAEEFGFVGSVMLLIFLAVYSTVTLVVALRAKQPIHRLVAIGCMVLLVGQSLVNIGVAIGALPTTGLPFPLMSYGGSSMIASLVTAGILIRVARESKESEVIKLPLLLPQRSSSTSPTTSPDSPSAVSPKLSPESDSSPAPAPAARRRRRQKRSEAATGKPSPVQT